MPACSVACRLSVLTSLTVGTRVALSACTLVLVGSCVDACASVQARLVGATVVQIWREGAFSHSFSLFFAQQQQRATPLVASAETRAGN